MKNRAFRKFVASIGVAAMVMSTATNAMSPAVTRAESAQELEGQQNDSQEQGGQEDPVAQSSDDANGAPFADAEPMAVSSEDSQDSQEAAGPSESSDSNGENGTEGSSGENTNASAGSMSTDASGAGSQDATGTMSGATNGTVGTTNSTITGTTNDTAGTINGATDTFANGTSTDASTGTTTGENGEASGDNAEASTKEITSVITEDIDLGTYPAGEAPAYAQLELPDEIEVKVDEEKQTVTVTWNGEETYHPDQAGTYIFSSELDKEWNKDENGNARYQLAEKVELPKASVRVEKKAESTEDSKAEVKSDNKTENKTDAKLDIKEDNKTDAKADNKSEGKTEEKSDNKSEVTTKPETTKATTKGTSKENTKETSKKDSASKDKTKDETEDETKGEAKNEAKEENKTATKDESAKADQKKVTNAAALKAVYVAEDGTILCGTVGLTGDSFTISDKAKSFNGYELKTVTLGEEELPQDTAFTRNTSTTETKEEIRTEASYTYTMDGAEHEIAAGDTATITFTYAQKEEVTPEIASIEVTGEAVDTTGAAIQGDYAFPLAVGTNDLSKTAPYIQGYEYQYAEIGTDKITSIAKEVLEAGKYAYYVNGELLKENTKITYVYQEDEDYTEQLTGACGNLTVTVSASKEAKLPEGTAVQVTPVASARIPQILDKVSMLLGKNAQNTTGVLYDITLVKDGMEIQPKTPVHVSMKFDGGIPWNMPEGKQITDTAIVHLHGGVADVVTKDTENAEFETEGFSVYGMVAAYEENTNGYREDKDSTISLVDVVGSTDGITVGISKTENVKRDEELTFTLRFNIDDHKLNSQIKTTEDGKQVLHTVWEYDLTKFMQDYPLMNLAQDGSGILYDGVNVAGSYRVENNKLVLKVEPEWLAGKTTGISGGFSFKAKLDADRIGTSGSKEIRFPGTGASTTIKFEDVSVTNRKYFGENQYYQGDSTSDGSSSQNVHKNADGSYTIYYKVETTTNAALGSLILHDTVGAGQSINRESIQIKFNGTEITGSTTVSVNGNQITANIRKVNGKVPMGKYEIIYATTVRPEDLENEMINRAYWTYDGKTSEDNSSETKFKIKKKLTVNKEVTEGEDEQKRKVYTYTITVGDGTYSLGGHTITDTMSDNQTFDGNFKISTTNGDLPTGLTSEELKATTDQILKDAAYSDGTGKLFSYVFPAAYDGRGPITITYSTYVDLSKKENLYGKKNVTNQIQDDHSGDTGDDKTTKEYDFGNVQGTISKDGVKFDLTNPVRKLAKWTITVNIDPSVTLPAKITVYGKEGESKYYYGNWEGQSQIPVDWNNITIDDGSGHTYASGSDYTIDESNRSIIFYDYNHDPRTIVIHLSTVIGNAEMTNNGKELGAYNIAHLDINDTYIASDDATLQYYSENYGISKTGSYDKENGVFNWEVTINPERAHFNPDRDVFFKDQIPEGMEIVPGSLKVSYGGKDSQGTEFWDNNYALFHEDVQINSENGIKLNDASQTNWNIAPHGLSGIKYTVCYQTRLTTTEKSAKGNSGSKKYTNKAEVHSTGESKWKETTAEVEWYRDAITKKDLSEEDLKGNIIQYQIEINKNALKLGKNNQLTLRDVLPSGTVLSVDQCEFTDRDGKKLDAIPLSYDTATNVLMVTVPDETYIIFTYKVIVQNPSGLSMPFSNTAELIGEYTFTDSVEKKHIATVSSSWIRGDANTIKIKKVAEESLLTPLPGAEFELSTVAMENGSPKTGANGPVLEQSKRETTKENGEISFTEMSLVNADSTTYTLYCLKETNAPEGRTISQEYREGYYFILYADGGLSKAEEFQKQASAAIEKEVHLIIGGNTLTISNAETTSVRGTKTWNDADNQDGKRPEKITVRLKADGTEVAHKEVTKDGSGNWSYSFENLPKYANGTEIVYTVTEDTVEDYTTVISGYDITNSYTPGKTSITVTKAWEDGNNQDGKRPRNVQVQLYADGTAVEGKTATLSESNNWTHTWDNLDQKKNGQDIAYTVEEVGDVDGYTKTVSGAAATGFTITNTHTPETTSVRGTKTWNDADNQDGKRPEKITVRLKADGTEVAHKEVTKDGSGNWSYSFENLPKYANGRKITYTVTEDEVAGYTTKVEGYNITNIHTPEVVAASITKIWDDDNNRDNKRPASIDVKLTAKVDGTEILELSKTATLKVANGWKVSWSDLPKYHDGKLVEYSADELNTPAGYTKSVSGDLEKGFTITNRYTPETVQVAGSKNWNDSSNAEGLRPGSITIRLYANGSEIDHKTVTEKDGWFWNWKDLKRYDTDHKEISYTISEDEVTGYTTEVNGFNVTNTRIPRLGSVILTKTDAFSGRGLVGAVFDLVRIGGTRVGSYTTNAAGVLRVDSLAPGDYYFTETSAPEGYLLDSRQIGFKITADTTAAAPVMVSATNKPVEEKVAVSANKVWDDENDADGVRPASVTFHLFADGVEIGSGTASAENGWSVSFGDLPKTKNGAEIHYTLVEDEVGNYYETSYETGTGADGSLVFTVKNYRETDRHYEERTGSVRGANRNRPGRSGGFAGAGRGRGTGDDANMAATGGVAGVSLLALIIWMLTRKRSGRGSK